jgi:type II secretory pathway pseudopilin PulG
MRFMPLLPQAWSRACEYSCDRAGLVVAGDLAASERGLAILAAGRTMAARMSVAAWSAQAVDETQRFWAHIWELNASHPYLTKRVRALREFCAPGTEPPVQRRILAIFLAPLLGQPVTAVVLVIYFGIFGLSAGIAAVSATNKRGAAAEAQALLSACRDAQTAFFAANGKWATRFDELKLDVDTPEKYTLYMGENALGPEQSVPVELRGYAVADGGFACVAVRNADSDDTWDVWIIDDNLTKPHHYVDDATEAVVDWRPQQPEAATDDTDDE